MNPTVNPNAHAQSITPEQLDALIAHREQGITVRRRLADALSDAAAALASLAPEKGIHTPSTNVIQTLADVAAAWSSSESFGLSELEAETEGWRQLRRQLSSGIVVPQFAGVRKQ